MEIGYKTENKKYPQTARLLFALPAAVLVAGAVAVAAPKAQANGGVSASQQAPSAAGFASLIADSTRVYQTTHGISARLANVNCVRASSVDYMCSYAVISPNRPRTCHLLQARWSPNSPSLYTVTLAGRVKACGTLREAVRSLP